MYMALFVGRVILISRSQGTVMSRVDLEAYTVHFAYVDLLISLQVFISFPCYFNKENIRSIISCITFAVDDGYKFFDTFPMERWDPISLSFGRLCEHFGQ